MPKLEYKLEALMRGKILFVFGLALGYVLGTRAGRERYEQIRAGAEKVWQDPRVQKQVSTVEGFVKDRAPDLAEKATNAVKKVASTVRKTQNPEGTS
jgi:oxygen-dependent protoporphyrinogen oxidase